MSRNQEICHKIDSRAENFIDIVNDCAQNILSALRNPRTLIICLALILSADSMIPIPSHGVSGEIASRASHKSYGEVSMGNFDISLETPGQITLNPDNANEYDHLSEYPGFRVQVETEQSGTYDITFNQTRLDVMTINGFDTYGPNNLPVGLDCDLEIGDYGEPGEGGRLFPEIGAPSSAICTTTDGKVTIKIDY